MRPRKKCFFLVAALLGIVMAISAQKQEKHFISAGLLKVGQIDTADNDKNCQVSLGLSINDFRVTSFNRGDYGVKIGADGDDDVEKGVLIGCVAQNGRNNFGFNNYPACSVAENPFYRLATCAVSVPGTKTSRAGKCEEYNVNVAAAWFPYSDWIGGYARNSTNANSGTNDLFTGSPDLKLGAHFKGITNGLSVVDLRSLGFDARRDGVLLVCHAKDEDNYASSKVNSDGTWNVYIRNLSHIVPSFLEQDPVAFVFIPKTNMSVVSGRFMANGAITIRGGGRDFTISTLGVGQWELKIPGYKPKDGVLIVSPEGGEKFNIDNIISYQGNSSGTGWEIQSRDLPAPWVGLQSPGVQDGGNEPVASFVFVPAATAAAGASANNVDDTIESQTYPFLMAAKPAPGKRMSLPNGELFVPDFLKTPANKAVDLVVFFGADLKPAEQVFYFARKNAVMLCVGGDVEALQGFGNSDAGINGILDSIPDALQAEGINVARVNRLFLYAIGNGQVGIVNLLARPAIQDRIMDVALIDYLGTGGGGASGDIDKAEIAPFLECARRAAAGYGRFTFSHVSAQDGDARDKNAILAARYLTGEINAELRHVASRDSSGLPIRHRADSGNFHVCGRGVSGGDTVPSRYVAFGDLLKSTSIESAPPAKQ